MIVSAFPSSWRTDVTVTRTGRDAKGNPLPPADHTVPGCLPGWGTTQNPTDRADFSTSAATLYVDDPMADFQDEDAVTIPSGPWPSGVWRVDGDPMRWQLGLAVSLKRN